MCKPLQRNCDKMNIYSDVEGKKKIKQEGNKILCKSLIKNTCIIGINEKEVTLKRINI